MNQVVEKDQDFVLSNNVDQKRKILPTKQSSFLRKRKLHSARKIKSRNFLTNISYNQLKQKNYDNQSLLIDSISYILLHYNPINLERKFFEKDDKEFINTLWLKCMPKEFLDFIRQEYYFKLLQFRI